MKNKTIYVAGHSGLVGSAIVRSLEDYGFSSILTKTHKELDLLDRAKVDDFFDENHVDVVILAAAKVGGIGGNSRDNAGFLYDNSMINFNVVDSAFRHGVKKLIFLGSSCIYPKLVEQPIKEDSLLTGALETTNEGYALAKITGIKYCQFLRRQYGIDYHSLMPCNLYGINDNYNLETGHVFPSLIRRFHEAKTENLPEVVLWGDGTPLREFLFAGDVGKAVVECLNCDDLPDIMNVGSGNEISIRDLAYKIADIVGYTGKIAFNNNGLNGTPRKLMDSSTIREKLGWAPEIDLESGIRLAYEDFKIKFRK